MRVADLLLLARACPPACLPASPRCPPLLQARENAGAAMFMEVLFWKGANVADDVRNEYNWRVSRAARGVAFEVLHFQTVL